MNPVLKRTASADSLFGIGRAGSLDVLHQGCTAESFLPEISGYTTRTDITHTHLCRNAAFGLSGFVAETLKEAILPQNPRASLQLLVELYI